MKQRMSRDLTARRYKELRASGMNKKQATLRIGQLILDYYDIERLLAKNLL